MALEGFLPFPQLRTKFELSVTQIFRYLQVKHFSATHLKSTDPTNNMTLSESAWKTHIPWALYPTFTPSFSPPALTNPYHIWPNGLQIKGEPLEVEDWNQIWSSTNSSSFTLVAKETNCEVLSRWYLEPVWIAQAVPNYSPLCFRGCSEIGSHIHIWWSCLLVSKFW